MIYMKSGLCTLASFTADNTVGGNNYVFKSFNDATKEFTLPLDLTDSIINCQVPDRVLIEDAANTGML